MLKIENTEVLGWEHAIRGMRNPLNSWGKGDSERKYENVRDSKGCFVIGSNDLDLMTRLRNAGTDHRKFMRMISVYVDLTAPLYWWKEFDTYKVGTVANSCSTMHKIAAKEFTLEDFSHEHLFGPDDMLKWDERKDIGRDNALAAVNVDGNWCYFTPQGYIQMTCNILNHYREKYLETKDKKYWWQMIQLLPSSYNQKRTVMLNYEVLANIYKSRRNHKLDEWHTFCDWIEGLPYSELITGIDWKKANPILHAERDENGNLLREMQKVIDPTERLSDTSKAVTDIMDKLIASRGKRSEIPGIIEDNIGCNEGLNKHFGGCEE
mgnify:CR=1 FL=1|jgi:hypothetical protein